MVVSSLRANQPFFVVGEHNARGHAMSCAAAKPLIAYRRASFGSTKLLERQALVSLRPQLRKISVLPRAGPSGEKFESDNKQYADLATRIEEEAAAACEALQGTSVFLVGMMGSGKSTVGKMVSQALGYCFFDTDGLIEQLAGKTVPEIFNEDGEADFRDLETQVLQELSPFKNCIVSTGGGVAIKPENWGHMHSGVSVWLNGPPTLLARRVVADGTDGRPLLSQQKEEGEGTADNGTDDGTEEYKRTVQKLTDLLEKRREQYAISDITVSLEGEDVATADMGAPAAVVVYRILCAINDRIKRDAAWREERKNFQVMNENLPPTMRVVKSINPTGDIVEIDSDGENDPYLP